MGNESWRNKLKPLEKQKTDVAMASMKKVQNNAQKLW